MCSLKSGLSPSSEGKHDLVDTHLHESICSHPPENFHESYTESLEMDFSSLLKEMCNLVDPWFQKISGSSPDKKHHFSDTISPEGECTSPPEGECTSPPEGECTSPPEGECTSPPENHYESYSLSPESDFSFQEEMLTPQSKCYPSHHRKHKLSGDGFSDIDCSLLPCVKRRLISGGSIESVSPSPTKSISGQSSDSDWLPTSNLWHVNELPLDIVMKASNDCEKMLRQIIRTAYQFTRHSHREKLSLRDLKRAFKIHNVDIRLDDSDSLVDKIDRASAENGDESQPFTCTGKWLSVPKAASLSE